MKLLILGRTGQLGQHLQTLLPNAVFWGREEADLLSPNAVQDAVLKIGPDLVVNAAAYTAVDLAEKEAINAWQVNVEGPASLARSAAILNIPLVHISTDYVFDGRSDRPYRNSDAVNPMNVYGRTKLAGELAITSLCKKYYIIRTSWLFSEHGSNFAKTIIRLAKEKSEITVVADQYGRPTYAGDLAQTIVSLVSQIDELDLALPWGIYHAGGGPETTWNEFALQILAKASEHKIVTKKPAIKGILTSQYETSARRPLYSVLEPTQELHALTGGEFNWRSGLTKMFLALGRN